jgi:dCMP deaminase
VKIEKAQAMLEIARTMADKLSKSPRTKVGALLVGPHGEIRSMGYAGAPRGCNADEDPARMIKPEKDYWVSHAELNAITNAARVGTPLDGSELVTTHFPCMDCARALVQVGVTTVYSPPPDARFAARWHEHLTRSEQLFEEVGLAVVWLEGKKD